MLNHRIAFFLSLSSLLCCAAPVLAQTRIDVSRCRTGAQAALFHLGRAEYERGREQGEAAIFHYTCALERDSSLALAYHGRGYVYGLRGEFTLALSDLTLALDLEPGNADFLASRGFIYSRMGETSAALNDLNRAIAFDPRSGRAYNSRAVVFATLGNFSRAQQDFERAAELGTDPPEQALWNLGNLFSKRGDLPRAVDALHRAARLNPNNPSLFQMLGDLYLQMGNLGAARDNYEVYVRLVNRADPTVLRYVEAGLVLRTVQRYAPGVLLIVLLVYLSWTTTRDLWRRWRPASTSAEPAPEAAPAAPTLSTEAPAKPQRLNRLGWAALPALGLLVWWLVRRR
ncbi:MAG: tetratricopeptide repeat protein [Anaerolineae bacterium]|nr:tetratricopeptide repeat protein [Anaerolineae bacterium]MDW8171924.1 tetratricopeptide repeat protein [Anaerolineae bacterium]